MKLSNINTTENIYAAVAFDEIEAVKQMIADGVDLHGLDEDGYNLMMIASSPEMIKLLIDSGVDIDETTEGGITPLMLVDGDVEAAEMLIEAGANVDAQDQLGATPLMYADSIDLAKFLVESGADLGKVNIARYTAEEFHASKGNTDIAEFLKSVRKEQEYLAS